MDFKTIKAEAEGRWAEILPALTPLTGRELVKTGKDHPCPLCNSDSTIWPRKNAERTGGVTCRKCCGRVLGDGIDTVAHFRGVGKGDALRLIAGYLGIEIANSKPPQVDLVEQVCRDKRMPIDAFRQFAPEVTTRNKRPVVRVAVYNGKGEAHSYFDFAPKQKGWYARGEGMSGMFFPGRLPQAGETWLLVEGCKDAAALIGMGYNAAGLAGASMATAYAGLFTGVHVVIVPDLDNAGQTGSHKTGGRLAGIAASVKVARLPGEMRESAGDDVRDCLAKSGEAALREAIGSASDWEPQEGEHDPTSGQPEVTLTLNYSWAVDRVLGHLAKVGWESPWIPKAKRERAKVYQRGGVLVHVVDDGLSGPKVRPLPAPQLAIRILDACLLTHEKGTGEGAETIFVPPPKWLIDGIHTRGEFGEIRRLEGISTAPTLRPDGTILQSPGYDDVTALIYQPNDEFPQVPESPTHHDAKVAVLDLLDVIQDFEFVDVADKSAWLSLVLSQVGRVAIDGCVPLHAIDATTRGSGKSLLADTASVIAYGRPAARKPYSTDDDEQRKAITATAMEALPSVLLDNVDRVLGGAAMDAALTAVTWSDRILGSSQTTGELPMRTVWAATGNNLRFGSDIARRVLPIRLRTSHENPEERTGFTHPNLLGWVRQNRPRLAVAALTILRAYFVAGRPDQPGGTFGSFEGWADLIRGAIVWAGMPDPLATRETAKAGDTSQMVVNGLIGGLLEVDEAGDGLTAKQIVDRLEDPAMAHRYPTLREVLAEVATTRGRIDNRRLAAQLRKYKGRIAGGFSLSMTWSRTKTAIWAVQAVGDAGDAGDTQNVSPAPSPARFTAVNTGQNANAGDAGDTFTLNAGQSLHTANEAATHTHTRSCTHVREGLTGESSPASPANEIYPANYGAKPEGDTAGDPKTHHLHHLHVSPPEGPPGPPCPKCRAITVLAPAINGWANADCPQCGHVAPARVHEVNTAAFKNDDSEKRTQKPPNPPGGLFGGGAGDIPVNGSAVEL